MIRNRIIDHILLRGRDLQDNAGNWRIHPQAQVDAVNAILANIGIVDELLIYNSERQDGWTVIDGHLRKDSHPDVEWPCTVVDLSDDEADAVLAAFDRLTAKAETDNERLGALIQQVQKRDAALLAGVFERDEVAEILALARAQQEPVADPGAQVDRASELQEKWQVERGQVWEAGRHRVMCGDCTQMGNIGKLMAGNMVDIGIHDPPYNINMQRSGSIVGDKQAPWDYEQFTIQWLDAFKQYSLANAAVYICIGFKEYSLLSLLCRKRWKELNCIVWAKPSIGMGGLDGGYRYQHELIWFGGGRQVRDKTRGDVWTYGRDNDGAHPTLKPLPLIVEMMDGIPGLAVADWFLGSGTTLVACEQTGRNGYGMEIEPKYVAVTLERLSQMGLEPRLVEQR
jgi:DNA modification methylase